MARTRGQPTLRVVLVGLSLLALGPLTLSNTSCCATLGYRLGRSMSDRAPPWKVPAGQALMLERGTPMSITLEDTTAIRGIFLGRARLDDRTYASSYDAWPARPAAAPALGAEIEIMLLDGWVERTRFDGFHYRSLRVLEGAGREVRSIPFSQVGALRVDAALVWTGSELAQLDLLGELPSREALRLGLGRTFNWNERWESARGTTGLALPAFPETTLVPADRVAFLQIPASRSSEGVLLLVGLGLDVIIVVGALTGISQSTDAACAKAVSNAGSGRTSHVGPHPGVSDRVFDTWAGAFEDYPAAGWTSAAPPAEWARWSW